MRPLDRHGTDLRPADPVVRAIVVDTLSGEEPLHDRDRLDHAIHA